MLISDKIFSGYRNRLLILFIVLITALAYVNSLKNSFVWDDYLVIVNNDFVKSWNNFHRIFNKNYLTKTSDIDYLGERDIGSGESSYRPIATLSYFVDFSIWKLNPFGYHFTNLILHILNAILLFIFIDLTVRNKKIALLTSLLFATHPINMETVNVISFRPNLLFFLFFISAFILYIKSRESTNGRKVAFYIASSFTFLLALFSKEMAVTFPIVLVCYDFFFKKMPKNILVHFRNYYLGYMIVLSFYFFVRFILIASIDNYLIALPFTNFYTRILTMSKVIVVYVLWMLFPINVHSTLPDDYTLFSYSLFEPRTLVSILAILALLVIVIRIRKKMPIFLFATLWFFITIIPVSNILYPLTNYMAARYLYLPIVGFCFLIAVFLCQLPDAKTVSIPPAILRKVTRSIIIILLIFYSMVTVINNRNWRNNFIFWLGMAEEYPNNALTHSSLASNFRERGLLNEAIDQYKIALSLDYNYAKDHNGLGGCYYEGGAFNNAIIEFKKALKLDPVFISAYINLGSVFGKMGLYQKAIRCFEKAIRLDRKSLNAYNNLGVTYVRMKDYNMARQIWEKALQIDSKNKEAKDNLKNLKQLGY